MCAATISWLHRYDEDRVLELAGQEQVDRLNHLYDRSGSAPVEIVDEYDERLVARRNQLEDRLHVRLNEMEKARAILVVRVRDQLVERVRQLAHGQRLERRRRLEDRREATADRVAQQTRTLQRRDQRQRHRARGRHLRRGRPGEARERQYGRADQHNDRRERPRHNALENELVHPAPHRLLVDATKVQLHPEALALTGQQPPLICSISS
jgi:hypothetical protein